MLTSGYLVRPSPFPPVFFDSSFSCYPCFWASTEKTREACETFACLLGQAEKMKFGDFVALQEIRRDMFAHLFTSCIHIYNDFVEEFNTAARSGLASSGGQQDLPTMHMHIYSRSQDKGAPPSPPLTIDWIDLQNTPFAFASDQAKPGYLLEICSHAPGHLD